MDIKEYIENRVNDQIAWHDQQARQAKTWYKRLQLTKIILASHIPLLAGYSNDYKLIPYTVGLLGAIIAITESILKLNKYHENWIQYRATAETLKYQKLLYLTGSAPYNKEAETAENVFIRNVEASISSENSQWENTNILGDDSLPTTQSK